MPNLYEDSAAAAVPVPPLDGDLRTDVVVVGGGITGLSTALHLAERGVAVAVLDAQAPGWGASGRNGGQVNPGLKHDPDRVEADFGTDLGGRMNVLAGAAPAFVFDLIQRHAIACEARRNGTLRAATRPRHAVRIRSTVEQLGRRQAPVELWEGSALATATGTPRYRAAMFDPRGGDLNPLSYVRGLARSAIEAGARIFGCTRACSIDANGARWNVATAAGVVSAEQVVLATNGYTDDLWPGLRRTIVPLFSAIAASEVLPASLAYTMLPGRSVLYESGAITVYYRIDASHRLLIGGRGPMREVTAPLSVAHIIEYARTLWPGLRGLEWTHAWGGRLAMTQDHYPHVHQPARGVWVGLGYNGRGIALATVMGAQLARRILDPAGGFDLPITDMKTIALHSLWPVAVRAAIARGRLTDFLGM